MRSAIAFILLTRPKNLIIIALTMYALRYGIIYPHLHFQEGFDFKLQFSETYFFLSVLVMVFLAAAGNIINDYFDVKVDRINRPNKVLVGKVVKRRVAMVSHQALNLVACLISFFLSWKTGLWTLFAVPIFMAASLWYYSLIFKRQLLIGNFVVALMVALIPLWTGVFEIQALNQEYSETIPHIQDLFREIWIWLFGYAAFAFMLTFSREILKDIEDYKGDSAANFRTLPIVIGINTARNLATGVQLTILGTLVFIAVKFLNAMHSVLFTASYITFLIAPVLATLILTRISKDSTDYGRASAANKISMLGGILFCGIIYITLHGA